MALIVEQICFLHLPPYKNCRKTLTLKKVCCAWILFLLLVCVWDLLFAVLLSRGIAKEAC